MIGFKNLIKINHCGQEQLANFQKTVEQALKIASSPLNYFQALLNANETSKMFFQKWLIEYQTCDIEQMRKSLFWSSLAQISKRLSVIQRQFQSQLKRYFIDVSKKANSKSTLEFQAYSKLKNKLRSYKSKEQLILQCYKNFCKLHKSVLTSIESYKKSFTDVKLVYNKQQRVKRYMVCESQYNQLISQYGKINDNLPALTELRNELLVCFNNFVEIIGQEIKNIGDCTLMLQNRFIQLIYQKQLNSINVFTNAISKLQKCQYQLELFFPLADIQAEKYIQPTKYNKKHTFIPLIVLKYEHIKDSHLINIGPLLSKYQIQLGQLIRKRKAFIKHLTENFQFMIKSFEKILQMNSQYRQGFQKRKKKFVGYYGVHHYFTSTFSSLVNEDVVRQNKMFKKICVSFKKIEQLINQESKCLQLLQKKFKAYCLQKFTNKKDSKSSNLEKKNIEKKVQMKIDDVQMSRIQIFQKMAHLKQFFESYHEKTKRICGEIKQQISQVLLMLQKSSIETYSLTKTENEINGMQNTIKNVNNEIDEVSLVKLKIFQQSILSGLLEEDSKSIMFEGDLTKIQEFKKLKKPSQVCEEKQFKDIIQDIDVNSKQASNRQRLSYSTQNDEKTKGDEKHKSKYEALLISKNVMIPDQKYIQSFKCALADSILLSGRLLITTERLCFYSKFNTSNIFFGETFIQIPKKDIKKIEKQSSALVFNNSISITTVHGQMFFTSFFSRNQAYDKILSALNKTLDQIEYEPQLGQLAIQQEVVAVEDDDIKEQVLQERAKAIDAKLKTVNYREILSTTLKFKDMTALKYFKMFEMDHQISYNRGKHLGFHGYFTKVIGHTEVVFGQWQPKITDYLNSSNIKNQTPLSFYRVVKQVIPLANTGIPFMPKTSKIQQRMNLYFYSKDKIVFQIDYKSFGVPYCDYFLLNFRKEITTLKDQNAVQFKMLFGVTFVSNTLMKNVIQNRSFEESKASMVKLDEEMKKYLCYLQKVTAKANLSQDKNEIENQELKMESQTLQQDQSEIQQLKVNKEQFGNTLNIQKQSHSKTKKILVASLLLNIALLLILMI